jgi:integrase
VSQLTTKTEIRMEIDHEEVPALAAYAAEVPDSSRAFLKAAISGWAEAMATAVKGMATPENVIHVQATLYRFEALQEAIKGSAAAGQKTHTWLSQREVRHLISLPDTGTRIGRRDKIALGLCVVAGLRRAEAVMVGFDDITLLPISDWFRTVFNVKGKGAKDRAVRIKDDLANDIDAWGREIGGCGNDLRDSLTAVSLFRLVNKYGRLTGHDELAPHRLLLPSEK